MPSASHQPEKAETDTPAISFSYLTIKMINMMGSDSLAP